MTIWSIISRTKDEKYKINDDATSIEKKYMKKTSYGGKTEQ